MVSSEQSGGRPKMHGERNDLRSGGAAIIFFTALSSTAAIATALLPFIVGN
jgi:hypothetical protein